MTENQQEDGHWLLWDRPRQGWYDAILDILDVSILEKLKIAPKDFPHTGLLLEMLAGLLALRGGTQARLGGLLPT